MPVAMRNDKPSYPKYELPNGISIHDKLNITELKEYEWLCHQITETKSRAAFFSAGDIIISIISMLPLFQEDSKSVSMIKHALNLVMNCINFLNPFQTPIAVLDQPLFALAKKIQWTWPGEMGEDHLVVLMGGLHIEMVMLEILGDWLQESGWTVVLKKANLNNPGVVESFLSDSHVKRSRYAHEVTACSLYILLNMAFTEQNEYEDMKTFISERCSKYPLFKYWYITLELEVLLLSFVRSFREKKFDLYVSSLKQIACWAFAFDHIHYARWLPVYIRDMIFLHTKHPRIYKYFQDGDFAVAVTNRKFSSVSIDQAHEMQNKIVNGDGGIIGVTDNQEFLNRWLICAPEVTRLLHEFECNLCSQPSNASKKNITRISRLFKLDFRKIYKI